MPLAALEKIRAGLQRPLPGLDAQMRMAPSPRLGWDPLKFPDGATNGGVTVGYVYGAMNLANTSDWVALRDAMDAIRRLDLQRDEVAAGTGDDDARGGDLGHRRVLSWARLRPAA